MPTSGGDKLMSMPTSGSNNPPISVKEKIQRWVDEGHMTNPIDEGTNAFDHAVHDIKPVQCVILEKGSVRSIVRYLYERYNQTQQQPLAQTVGEITQAVDYGQSTVTKAIKQLEEAPVVARMTHPSPNRDNIIVIIPPVLEHLKYQWETFAQKAQIPPPSQNSRAEGIISVYQLHESSDESWEANNNIEIWYRGELMGIAPNTDLNINATRDQRGLIDITVSPGNKDLPDEVWKQITKHTQALTQGLAAVAGYDPDTGQYLPASKARDAVTRLTSNRQRQRSNRQEQRLVVDFMDTELCQ